MADDWLWCGYPHHFIGGSDCLFSLATFVGDGRWLISTVGDYCPAGKLTSLGLNGAMFESMVFAADPERITDGEPTVTDWLDKECRRYATASQAKQGHMALCKEWETRRG